MEPPDLYRELLGRGRATEPELDAESREDLARLLRFLAVSERFDLFFLRFDADAVLDFVTAALRGRYGERLVVCALPGGQADVDPVVALMHAVRGAGTERPIFLLRGFDAVLGPFGERTMVLRVLNERRDLLPMHVPGPLIVALRPQQLLQLREHAADLWSIYTAVFSFRGLPHQAPPFGAELPWLDAPEDYAARIERLAVLPGDEATRLRAHLLRRQALALSLRGDAQRAEETWAAALTTARAAGEHEEQAAMLLERCAARAERGRHDEARQDLADARALASRLAGPAWPATIAAHAAHLDFQRGLYSSAAEAFASAHRFADAAGIGGAGAALGGASARRHGFARPCRRAARSGAIGARFGRTLAGRVAGAPRTRLAGPCAWRLRGRAASRRRGRGTGAGARRPSGLGAEPRRARRGGAGDTANGVSA